MCIYDIVELLNAAACVAFNLCHGMRRARKRGRERGRERERVQTALRRTQWHSAVLLCLCLQYLLHSPFSLCNLLSACTLIDNIFVQCVVVNVGCCCCCCLGLFVCLCIATWSDKTCDTKRHDNRHTHTEREKTHTCTHNSHYEIFVKFHTKYKEACHVCMCVRRHKVKFIQEVGCLILTCLALPWLAACPPAWFWPWFWPCLWQGLSPLASALELIMKHCLLHKVWLRNENSKKTSTELKATLCHLIRSRHNCKAADIKIIFTRTKVGAHNA